MNLLGNAVPALLRHPGRPTLLRERPEPMPHSVEEFPRHGISGKRSTNRCAAEDIERGGVRVLRGGIVVGSGPAGHDAPRAAGCGKRDRTEARGLAVALPSARRDQAGPIQGTESREGARGPASPTRVDPEPAGVRRRSPSRRSNRPWCRPTATGHTGKPGSGWTSCPTRSDIPVRPRGDNLRALDTRGALVRPRPPHTPARTRVPRARDDSPVLRGGDGNVLRPAPERRGPKHVPVRVRGPGCAAAGTSSPSSGPGG